MNELEENLKRFFELEEMFGNREFISQHKKILQEGKVSESEKDKSSMLKKVRKQIANCKECQLHEKRKNVVPGEGNTDADLIFIGEAPGREEDNQGRPFVGRAGNLLTKIIKAMKMTRGDVFIGNIIKCRPPNNRNPYPYEIKSCEPYLLKQLKIIDPKVICTLGKFATQSLLKKKVPISKIRGKFQDYHGIKLMPTYHPGYLLRNPSGKPPVWEDMKKIMKFLGVNE